jgi:tryptophan-rich sensory protein
MRKLTEFTFRHIPEILGIVLSLLLCFISAYATSSSDYAWYAALHKPSFNPPNFVFAPVWTVLYIMIGIVLGRIYKLKTHHPILLSVWILQLVFNGLWSFLFFQYHAIFWAMLDLIALWLSLSLMILLLMDKDKLSLYLVVPYWLWVNFALILNVSIYLLN